MKKKMIILTKIIIFVLIITLLRIKGAIHDYTSLERYLGRVVSQFEILFW